MNITETLAATHLGKKSTGSELYGHEWYDFINFYGHKYIIIFTDYFKTMKYNTIEDSDTDINKIADNFIGNSWYSFMCCYIWKCWSCW